MVLNAYLTQTCYNPMNLWQVIIITENNNKTKIIK